MSLQRYRADPALGDYRLIEAAGLRALVRDGWEEVLARVEEAERSGERVGGGRAAHPVVELGGERIVVRSYRRGGLVRFLSRDRYLAGHRALEELRVTVLAAGAGARVPDPVAAVEREERWGYRAWLATRFLPDAQEMDGWLRGARASPTHRALVDAGAQIALLHDAGIGHPDLNLRNLLVQDGSGGPRVTVIDFDRATADARAVRPAARARALRRLRRSAGRLGTPIDTAGWAALRGGYGSGWPTGLELG